MYTIQTAYLELMHSYPYYFLFTQFFMITTSIPILLVKILIFLFYRHLFHVHVQGQCPAAGKYNLI